jgi:hypothetical protein
VLGCFRSIAQGALVAENVIISYSPFRIKWRLAIVSRHSE